MNIKRLFSGLILSMLVVSTSMPAKAQQQEHNVDSKINIISEYKPSGDTSYKYEFVDKSLENTSKSMNGGIQSRANVDYRYSHSYYVSSGNTLNTYNYRTNVDPKFLISVARGETQSLSNSITVSATISYSKSISAGIKDVCNASLTGSVSGTVSYTHSTSTVYVGPDAPYNSRDYYSATNFDLYTCKVSRYDVYNEVTFYWDSNGVYHEYVSQYNASSILAETVTIDNVQSPKIVHYSKDFMY